MAYSKRQIERALDVVINKAFDGEYDFCTGIIDIEDVVDDLRATASEIDLQDCIDEQIAEAHELIKQLTERTWNTQPQFSRD